MLTTEEDEVIATFEDNITLATRFSERPEFTDSTRDVGLALSYIVVIVKEVVCPS